LPPFLPSAGSARLSAALPAKRRSVTPPSPPVAERAGVPESASPSSSPPHAASPISAATASAGRAFIGRFYLCGR
jgi:hypothetical protein